MYAAADVVVARASQDRATSALELEIQAEVDKWVVLAGDIEDLDVEKSAHLRERLYERVAFVHIEDSELGERYRVANRAALRFVRRMARPRTGSGSTSSRGLK